jgi:hypothetical protein
MQEKDSHILKFSGKAELPEAVEVGNNYELTSTGSIIAQTKSDNHDGSFTYTYTFKPVLAQITSNKGQSLRLRDSRSTSQILRSLLWKKWVNSASQITFEDFYEKFVFGVMRDCEELLDRYE